MSYEARKEGFKKWVKWLHEPEQIANRFWKQVSIGGIDECWPWTGSRDGNGKYGLFSYKGNITTAHRVAYILVRGGFDQSFDMCHHCDNPPCCNPCHLFPDTRSGNIKDAVRKGRWNTRARPGELSSNHKLTEKEVIHIRDIHRSGAMSQREIARKFGVNFHTINLIVLRKNWAHI